MVKKRSLVTLKHAQLCISELDDLVDAATGQCLTGSWLWPSALVLAHWLDNPLAWPPSSFTNKRVVELGAGTGLPGLVAAVLGAQVVLTDRLKLLPCLQLNVYENGLRGNVTVQPLEWGEDCSPLSPPFDFILMSDLLYDVDAMPDLCKTMADLSGAQTEILLAYELRFWTNECFRILLQNGFRWSKVAEEEMHTLCRFHDIGIVRVRSPAVAYYGANYF